MSTTQPIKSKKDLFALKNFYLKNEPNLRNYALICTGINTALRISDILELTWEDVYDFRQKRFRPHLTLRENKTGKKTIIALNKSLQKALATYKKACPHKNLNNIFSQARKAPLSPGNRRSESSSMQAWH